MKPTPYRENKNPRYDNLPAEDHHRKRRHATNQNPHYQNHFFATIYDSDGANGFDPMASFERQNSSGFDPLDHLSASIQDSIPCDLLNDGIPMDSILSDPLSDKIPMVSILDDRMTEEILQGSIL